jgi:hypothetical protein
MDAVAFQAAVAEDFLALHAGEGVLDAGANSLVGAVVFLLPGGEFLALRPSVRDDESGALVAVDLESDPTASCCTAAGYSNHSKRSHPVASPWGRCATCMTVSDRTL